MKLFFVLALILSVTVYAKPQAGAEQASAQSPAGTSNAPEAETSNVEKEANSKKEAGQPAASVQPPAVNVANKPAVSEAPANSEPAVTESPANSEPEEVEEAEATTSGLAGVMLAVPFFFTAIYAF